MFSRTRVRSVKGPTGTRTWSSSSGLNSTQSYTANSASCVDIVGSPGMDHSFLLDNIDRSGGTMVGTVGYFGGTITYSNFPCLWARTGTGESSFSSPPAGTYRDLNQVLASHHPGEPAVSLPVFLFELKDVPHMLKHAFGRARSLSDKVGSGPVSHRDVIRYLHDGKRPAEDWLNYNFGWRPLVSDLTSILGLSKEVAKRAKFIRQLRKNHIRRQSALGEYSNTFASDTYTGNVIYYTDYPNIRGSLMNHETHKKWVSSRWTVGQEMFQAAYHPESGAMQRAVLGLDISITHAYDATPWTWLTDWFTGLGDIIHAQRNRFGIKFASACLMHQRTLRRTVTAWPHASTLSCLPYTFTRESKTRTLVAPSLANWGGINITSASQLATLSSLAVTRGYGSRL